MADKKSKTTSGTLTLPREMIEDCVSSWLTAIHYILREEFVTEIKLVDDSYIVTVRKNGEED